MTKYYELDLDIFEEVCKTKPRNIINRSNYTHFSYEHIDIIVRVIYNSSIKLFIERSDVPDYYIIVYTYDRHYNMSWLNNIDIEYYYWTYENIQHYISILASQSFVGIDKLYMILFLYMVGDDDCYCYPIIEEIIGILGIHKIHSMLYMNYEGWYEIIIANNLSLDDAYKLTQIKKSICWGNNAYENNIKKLGDIYGYEFALKLLLSPSHLG